MLTQCKKNNWFPTRMLLDNQFAIAQQWNINEMAKNVELLMPFSVFPFFSQHIHFLHFTQRVYGKQQREKNVPYNAGQIEKSRIRKKKLASKDRKRWRAKGKIRKTNNAIIEHISTVQNCNHTYVLVSCLCRCFFHLVFFNFPLILSLASHSFSHIFFSAPFIFRRKYVFACFPFYILSAFYLFSLEFEERVI